MYSENDVLNFLRSRDVQEAMRSVRTVISVSQLADEYEIPGIMVVTVWLYIHFFFLILIYRDSVRGIPNNRHIIVAGALKNLTVALRVVFFMSPTKKNNNCYARRYPASTTIPAVVTGTEKK